jgi:hypothetical protein
MVGALRQAELPKEAMSRFIEANNWRVRVDILLELTRGL